MRVPVCGAAKGGILDFEFSAGTVLNFVASAFNLTECDPPHNLFR
jgi:hypothetical protein